MKTYYIFLVTFLISATTFAQNGINYKALIKDANGDVIINQAVIIQFQILEDGTTNVYQETHNPTTDANGIAIVNIGEGVVDSGNFVAIAWGAADHFLNVQVDTNDGAGLVNLGTTEFKSVPYAKMAETVTNLPLTNLNYPDGLQNMTPVYIASNPDYAVPAGKNLYITHILSTTEATVSFINSTAIEVFQGSESNQGFQKLTQPLIAGSNEIVSVTAANIFGIYGFLVDAKVEVVKSMGAPDYTVPTNKLLVITNTRSFFSIDNNFAYTNAGTSGTTDIARNSFYNPIVLDEMQVVDGNSWTGYLIDKN